MHRAYSSKIWFDIFYVRVRTMTAINCQSQIKNHTDKQTQVHSAWSSLAVTHPSTNRGRPTSIHDKAHKPFIIYICYYILRTNCDGRANWYHWSLVTLPLGALLYTTLSWFVWLATWCVRLLQLSIITHAYTEPRPPRHISSADLAKSILWRQRCGKLVRRQ